MMKEGLIESKESGHGLNSQNTEGGFHQLYSQEHLTLIPGSTPRRFSTLWSVHTQNVKHCYLPARETKEPIITEEPRGYFLLFLQVYLTASLQKVEMHTSKESDQVCHRIYPLGPHKGM